MSQEKQCVRFSSLISINMYSIENQENVYKFIKHETYVQAGSNIYKWKVNK